MRELSWNGKPSFKRLSPYSSIQISFFLFFSMFYSVFIVNFCLMNIVADNILLFCLYLVGVNIILFCLYLLLHVLFRYYRQKEFDFFITNNNIGITQKGKKYKCVPLSSIHSIAYIKLNEHEGHIIFNHSQCALGLFDENQLRREFSSICFNNVQNGYNLFCQIRDTIYGSSNDFSNCPILEENRNWRAAEIVDLIILLLFLLISIAMTVIVLPFGMCWFIIALSLLKTYCHNITLEKKQERYECDDTVYIKRSGIEIYTSKRRAGKVKLNNGIILYGKKDAASISAAIHLYKNTIVFGARE